MPDLPNTRDRGQVGIETLIIFIAMILVAAIAAGILINTAGFLQNKASATSEDSTEQVSNQVVVISAVGEVDSTGSNITALNMTVMLSPGADEIDLSEATVDWIGPNGHATLNINGSIITDPIYPPPCYFTGDCLITLGVKDVDASTPVLNAKDDRIRMSLALQSGATVPGSLAEGEEVTMKIVTQSGSSYTYVANTPESLSSRANSAVAV